MKSFSKQYRECVKNKTAYRETICGVSLKRGVVDVEIMACKKYGGQCQSGKCREARR